MTAWVDPVVERWQREPVQLAAPTPVPRQRAFEAIRTACAPFRAGTRFRALPDVRFRTAEGQLRAPADLLPDDGDLRQYQDRLGSGYQLVVEQPLLLDFPLWSAVRDEISPLWRQVGWPTLPVVVELVVADDHTDVEAMTRAPTHATLIWVLDGDLQVRLLPPGTDPTLDPPAAADTLAGKEGDLLYWPAGQRPLIEYGSRAAVLSLRIAQDPRLAVAAVHDLLGTLAAPRAGYDGTVPYLEFPPPAEIAAPLAAVGTAVRDVLAEPRIETVLRQQWMKCRSAAGLLPPPAPRPQPGLTPEDRVRVTSEIVTMPTGPDRWLCGMNGHSFELGGAAGRRLLDALRPGRLTTIAELCAEVGARDDSSRRVVLALLDKLHGLRGIMVAAEAEVPCP